MSAPVLLALSPALESQLRRHCESAYPNEACGVLLGEGDGTSAAWLVREVEAAPNEYVGDKKRHYMIPPEFQLQAELHADATGQEVLGYYHSHPDHSAQPSGYDAEYAWFGYVYLICAVEEGHSAQLNAFTLDEPGEAFQRVEVRDER